MPALRVAKNNLGQSLLEVIVLMGLALVIVTGLTVVTVNGLKNSQFSQNQAQATRLAEEGIDCVRTIRDKNLPVCIGGTGPACAGGTAFRWYDRETYPNQMWSFNLPAPGSFFMITTLPGNSCTGLQNTTATPPNDTSVGLPFSSTFSRRISIQNYNVITQKRVTVLVLWNDISGLHQSQLVTVLSNY